MNILDRLLEQPAIYDLSQRLWYRAGRQEAYVRDWIRPRPDDSILDLGCGPGAILNLLPSVRYVGWDPNPQYIAQAAQRYGTRGRFLCWDRMDLPPAEREGTYNIVLANGVLHHLADDDARGLIRVAWRALKPGGRLVTRDGCFEESQSWFARFLLQNDRGAHVRTASRYEDLFRERFHQGRSEIVRDALRLPYSLIHFEWIKTGN